ncbi:rhomboid family intramembrane serine protease [Puia dinghuensis]|uniref:rhomboid family intramembrane serine protease n=1 Tax=Puia dinghuensis TaxID=1792502 RepID=UPI001E54B2F6|nr:rhomboid family intramembrane serine protease [Puia dinghuensis]
MIYLAQKLLPDMTGWDVTEWGALHHWSSPLFKPHQIITHMFMHDPQNFGHILFNMFALWMFGSILENYWGTKRFLNFYIICGIGAAVVQVLMIPYEAARFAHASYVPEAWPQVIQAYTEQYSMIGASGAIMGVMAAFAYLFPNTELFIFLIPVPVKAKYVIPVYVLIDLFGGFGRQTGDNIGHFAHLGGALVGIIIVIIMNRTNRRNFY